MLYWILTSDELIKTGKLSSQHRNENTGIRGTDVYEGQVFMTEEELQPFLVQEQEISKYQIKNVYEIEKSNELFDYISLQELCEKISISVATGKNWIKLGKIVPQYIKNGIPYFSENYMKTLKKEIQSGVNGMLKNRRNKKYISGNVLYRSYISENSRNINAIQSLLHNIEEYKIDFNDNELELLIAECAIQLFVQRLKNAYCNVKLQSYLYEFIVGNISLGIYDKLIDVLIENHAYAIEFINKYPYLFDIEYQYEEKEDVLGLLYISCKNIGNRKATGSYYTPTKVVKQVISKWIEKNELGKNVRILDPCCGTGNFLLQFPDSFSIENIHGNDIDLLSVEVTRINMALKFQMQNIDILYKNITNQDFLQENEAALYDFIVGNPPWGYVFSQKEKFYMQQNYASAVGKKIESYNIFVEKALSRLKIGGVLSFVLPEAILNVKSHMPIRNVIAENNSIQYLKFLGNVFEKVQCPCIILQLVHTGEPISCSGMEVEEESRCFTLMEERQINIDYFDFTSTDKEYGILKKMENLKEKILLKNHAKFALGIVTGNNKKYISEEKNDKNEIILKGSDIKKYRFGNIKDYIEFQPKQLQQVAPVEYYRAPEKLMYRFICKQLVFVYDDRQTLSLNSCNIVIPQVKGMSMKYILAILNSRMAQFYFRKQFHSVKVLRSHIEQIPIPVISENKQGEYIEIVDELRNDLPSEKILKLYNQLDEKISKLYLLNEEEYQLVKNTVDRDNLFLI